MKRQAYNPFLPLDTYIPDGEPHVFGEKVYLFGSHDKERGDSFCMLDYEGWSADINDLGNWQSSGIIYSAKQDPLFNKERQYMYAPDVVQGNDGKYYLYYCLAGWRGNGGYDGPISVAVCDTPNGKYSYLGYVKNADGTPYNETIVFDPALINDNGTIRLYTGTGFPWGMQIKWYNRPFTAYLSSSMYHRPKREFKPKNNPLGATMLVLDEDMLTVKVVTKNILPTPTKKNGFLGHAFYEGASIRKINDKYYFIYSSQCNHELCYAVSDYPDRDFIFGGTIVSCGDIGLEGREEKDRLNHTGTTHGSIEKIKGEWYVFYHRLTHGTDYSRQACAEKITILPNGEIPQVELTSCGLNGGDLSGKGIYPAVICCNLSNGKMPHGGNRVFGDIPMVTSNDGERFLTNLKGETTVGYKYFDLSASLEITLKARGEGKLSIVVNDKKCCDLAIESENWQDYLGKIEGAKHSKLEFKIDSGGIDIIQFEIK